MTALFAPRRWRSSRQYYFFIIAAMVAAIMLLIWSGYRATSEWRRSARLLVEQRTAEVVTVMIMAIGRDMRGVQSQVLPQLETLQANSALYELADEVAMAFSRFPYPESFFSWTTDESPAGRLHVFNRADRPPQWHDRSVEAARFPTTMLENPMELDELRGKIHGHSSLLTRFVIFETDIAGHPYQVIARLQYGGPRNTTLQSYVGFTVNIEWVRAHYFSELISQLSRILSVQDNMVLTIFDEHGRTASSTRHAPPAPTQPPSPMREHLFPLLFFDPALRASASEEALPVKYWTARAEAVADQPILVAANEAQQTFILIAVAASVAWIALALTIRAIRAGVALTTMKSEFVSAVTHELKTPLASIRLTSETLAQGRFRSQETIAEYAGLLLNEVARLTRMVDNLLSIARVHDVTDFYIFAPVNVTTLVTEILNRFQSQLQSHGFDVVVEIPDTLPPVRADRTALLHVLDNLIDNAIRYADERRRLEITAAPVGAWIGLRVADQGVGIPPDELPRVFDKFFRGRDVIAGGSGLGLAIAQRILQDHGGEIQVHSTVGQGTVVELRLPPAESEEA